MKIKVNRSINVAGNALLVTVIFILVLTMSIGGYMTYVMQQARMGARSQAWNMALAVSEAGIEEGLQHLNADAVGFTNNLGADNWTVLGNQQYSVQRILTSGSFPANYTVTIDFNNTNQPIITAIAHVTPPAVARKSSPFFYATATPNNTVTVTNQGVGRGVLISCFKPPFFNAALVAKGNINMNGNNVTVDSFDSGIAGQNVNGQWSLGVSGDGGIVASIGGISNSISIGNADIYGSLYSGVNEATNVGTQGFVGTHSWVAAGGHGFQPGHTYNDANFTFPDTTFPYGAGDALTPSSNSVAVVNGTNTVATTNANMTSLPNAGSLTNGQTLGSITTNRANLTVAAYPGNVAGLVTNYTSTTVGSNPGSKPGLSTNCVGFTTVTVDPGSQQCLTSATVATNVTSTADIPSPSPSGLSTNTTAVNNASSPPGSGTYVGNVGTNSTVSTNTASTTTSGAPSPGTYAGNVVTNTSSVTVTGSGGNPPTYPSPGTYVGSVVTIWNGGHTKITGYKYNQINNYTYNKINGYSTNATYSYTRLNYYSYPVTYYTYANQLSYTYQILTYTYSTNTFTYTLFSQVPTYITNSYDDVLSGGNYYSTTGLGNTIITGNSTLIMPNGYDISNLKIAPGGSLVIYCGGTSLTLNGNNVINDQGLAQNLIVYCSPTVTDVSLSGNAAMSAVIVAPNANVRLNGSGNAAIDYSGAIMANTVTMNGHFNFHYDAALSRIPSPGRFVASSWQELRNVQ